MHRRSQINQHQKSVFLQSESTTRGFPSTLKAAATTQKTPTQTARTATGSASRGSTKSPTEGKESEEAANLTARMGDLLLTEKESAGFVFQDLGQDHPTYMR